MAVEVDQILEAAQSDTAAETITALLDELKAEHGEEVAKGLTAKNKELLGKLAALKPYKDLGRPAEEIRAELDEAKTLKERLEELEAAANGGGKGSEKDRERFQKQLEELRLELDATKTTAQKEAEKLKAERKELSDRLFDERVRRLMNLPIRDIQDGLDEDVYRRLRPVFHFDEESEAIELRNPTTGELLRGAKGEMTVDELFDALRLSAGSDSWNSKGAAYFRSNGTGSGEEPGSHVLKRGGPPKKPRSKMTTAEKVAFIDYHGQEAYQSLPRE